VLPARGVDLAGAAVHERLVVREHPALAVERQAAEIEPPRVGLGQLVPQPQLAVLRRRQQPLPGGMRVELQDDRAARAHRRGEPLEQPRATIALDGVEVRERPGDAEHRVDRREREPPSVTGHELQLRLQSLVAGPRLGERGARLRDLDAEARSERSTAGEVDEQAPVAAGDLQH
jgi:hypothetical protein